MLKKSLIALMLSIACGVASIANAQLEHYFPNETVGAADGDCYTLTAATTLSQTYTKVGDAQTSYPINLLSLTLHNPEMIDNYVCSYEKFADTIYMPILAVSLKNESSRHYQSSRDIVKYHNYVYDVKKKSFDFTFLMDENKIVVFRGNANMFSGYTYATTYYKREVSDNVPTRLTALMLVKALDYKLVKAKSEDAMDLHKPDKTFKVERDFESNLINVTTYKDGKYYCSYKMPFSCNNIVMHKAGEPQWKYQGK